MALQRLKQFEKIEIKDKEKDIYRSLQSMVKKMFYACCGKRKTMHCNGTMYNELS